MNAGFVRSPPELPHRVQAAIVGGEQRHDVWFSSSDAELFPSGNALFAAALIPSMRTGGALEIHEPVSRHLLEAAGAIADVLVSWYPQFHRVAVQARETAPGPPSGPRRTAAFFSGGVDSFYTLIKHQEDIEDLIFVHGFDIPLARTALRGAVSENLRAAAGFFGKRLIEVETNLRGFHNLYARWGTEAHGAALAAVAHLLEERVSRVYIPASSHILDLIPWGSHPLLDPLWSSDRLRFFHDGCEASRFEKVERVARSPEALRVLRVCWKNPNDLYNCCRCEKCVRTMMHLDALGVLEECPTFPAALSTRLIEGIDLSAFSARLYYYQTLNELVRRGLRPDLQRVLLRRLRPYREVDPVDTVATTRGGWAAGAQGWLSRVRRQLGRRRASEQRV